MKTAGDHALSFAWIVRTNDVRQQAAANFEPIKLIEMFVGINGGELEDLVEARVRTGRFGVVKNESHGEPREV